MSRHDSGRALRNSSGVENWAKAGKQQVAVSVDVQARHRRDAPEPARARAATAKERRILILFTRKEGTVRAKTVWGGKEWNAKRNRQHEIYMSYPESRCHSARTRIRHRYQPVNQRPHECSKADTFDSRADCTLLPHRTPPVCPLDRFPRVMLTARLSVGSL